MKSLELMCLSIILGLTANSVAAQEIESLVTLNAANKSASPAVTRSIATYIATRNSWAAVQAMAQPPSTEAPPVTVEALLTSIETNSRILAPEVTPAAVTTPPAPEPPKKTKVKIGGGDSGGGAGGGGGGGWR